METYLSTLAFSRVGVDQRELEKMGLSAEVSVVEDHSPLASRRRRTIDG